jgi:hypothetical protein
MKMLWTLILTVVPCVPALSQGVIGTTTIHFDPNSGIGTATCETALDSDNGFYESRTSCSVVDQYGTVVATGTADDPGDRQGSAAVTVTFTGTPGYTYTATSMHQAAPTVPFDTPPGQPAQLYDEYNFQSFAENPESYDDYWEWYGPGPQLPTKQRVIRIGNTYAIAIRYYTPTELSQLITSAQSLFPAHCDAIFASVVGPSYTNANFFAQLRITSIIQYPPGATPPPDIPNPLDYPDADTQIGQPGKPIRVFINFYPTKSGFAFPSFREFVLIHEGLHHYTGWYDFPKAGFSDFKTKFYNSGYRNNGSTTGPFTDWLHAGCPPAPPGS